jgi:hypothetical protein
VRIKGKKVMIWAGIILGVVFCLVVFGPFHLYFGSVKGRIIDKETKKPIEGALIIYHWTGYYRFIDTTPGTNVYNYTKTDKDGYFKIPTFFRPVLIPRDYGVHQGVFIYAHGYKYEIWSRKKEKGLGRIRDLVIEMEKVKRREDIATSITKLDSNLLSLSHYCSPEELFGLIEFILKERNYLVRTYPEEFSHFDPMDEDFIRSCLKTYLIFPKDFEMSEDEIQSFIKRVRDDEAQ